MNHVDQFMLCRRNKDGGIRIEPQWIEAISLNSECALTEYSTGNMHRIERTNEIFLRRHSLNNHRNADRIPKHIACPFRATQTCRHRKSFNMK